MSNPTYNEVLAASKLLRKHGKTAAQLVNEHMKYLQTTEEFQQTSQEQIHAHYEENYNFSKAHKDWPTLADFKRAILQLGLNYVSKNS